MTDRPFRDEPTEVLETALGLADTHAQQAARFQPEQPGDELPVVASLFRAELQHREGSVTSNCPNCQHPQHLPGTECDARIDHGPSRFHACLCLARPGAANACPPQMTCQGGTLGYADIWYLQHGHTLSSADGAISPEVLADGPAPAAALSAPADDDLRERLREVADRLAAHAKGFQDVLDESDRGPWGRTVGADIDELRALLAALPEPRREFDAQAGLQRLADDLQRGETAADLPAPGESYRHYKGGLYTVLAVAEDTGTGAPVVVYRDEQERHWARPLVDFAGTVTDGVRRFVRESVLDERVAAAKEQQAGESDCRTPETHNWGCGCPTDPPHRGDKVERWLKQQRDKLPKNATEWTVIDGVLDRYRLHADTGTLLDQHVCEGQVVDDCDCLEQPAVEARQADTAGEGR